MKFAGSILKNGWVIVNMMPYDLNDVDYARFATASEWLRDRGYDPDTIFHPENVDPHES